MSREERSKALRRLAVPTIVLFAVTVRIVVVVVSLVELSSSPDLPEDYVGRFTEIASAEGRPYRDHDVEYPPVTVAAIELVGGPDQRATGVRLVWFSVLADALIAVSLLWAWGGRAAVAYLVASLPVLGALFATLDVLPAALAVAGVALARKRHERSGGLLLAAAVLAKVWPVVLVPGLFVWGRRRALLWSVAALVVGTLVWVLWAGPAALSQVATQRGSPGWESESTIGVLVRVIGDEPVRIVKDSPRVGVASGWAKALLTAATAAGVMVLWRRAGRDRLGEIGPPSLACVALLLFFSPIYSFPYIVWLLPWAAISLAEGRRDLAALAFGVEVLTTVAYALLQSGAGRGALWVYLILLVRDALTGAIPLAYLVRGTYTANVARSPRRT